VGFLPGHGSPDLGVPIWDLGFGRSVSWLLWPEQAAEPPATMPLNKTGTASCFPTSDVPLLFRLPLAGRGGEGKEMVRVRMSGSGDGGSLPALARGRSVGRRSASSSLSFPSPSGRGGVGRRWSTVRRVACSPMFKRGLVFAAASQACSLFPAGQGGDGEDEDCRRLAAASRWPGGPAWVSASS
jgi:hypothetical protein